MRKPDEVRRRQNARAFVVCKVLPLGTTFPYDFGFVPGTQRSAQRSRDRRARGVDRHTLDDLGARLVREIGDFLQRYTGREGRTFTMLGPVHRRAAHELVRGAA